MRGSTMLAQVRATTLTGTTTLTVPFSTSLTVGAVQAQVYMQTGSGTYSLIGTLALTITDTRQVCGAASVRSRRPYAADLSRPPASFTITCNNLANLGFHPFPTRRSSDLTMLAQVRATTLTGTTTLTVPFSTSLTVGAVQAQVYAQTGNATYSLIGTLALTVTDTRPFAVVPGVSAIRAEVGGLADQTSSFKIPDDIVGCLVFEIQMSNF